MSAYNRLLRRNWGGSAANSANTGKLAARLDHVYCAEHSRKSLISRQKLLGRKRPLDLTQRCLEDLNHYKTEIPTTNNKVVLIKPDVKEDSKSGILVSEPPKKKKVPDPFLSLCTTEKRSFTEGGSDVEKDDDDETIENAWRGDGDSDAESIDSDMENPLKHAGGYSAEEVIRIMRDKLIRLQKSYIDQFQRLQYLLREERRQYKHHARKEKETMMSIHQQPKDSPSEKAAYEMIKSLNHYNKPQGKDAVFASSVKQKRFKMTEGPSYKPSTNQYQKCSFNITSHTKCGETCVPLTKYCMKHVMEDSNQVLFRPCGYTTEADGPCEIPIVDTFEGNTCVYHTHLQPSYNQELSEQKSDVLEATASSSQLINDTCTLLDYPGGSGSLPLGSNFSSEPQEQQQQQQSTSTTVLL